MSQAISKLQQGGSINPARQFKVGNELISTDDLIKESSNKLESYLSSKQWNEDQKAAFRNTYASIIDGINNGDIQERTAGRQLIDKSGSYSDSNLQEYNEAVTHYLNGVIDSMPKTDPNKKEKLSEYLKKNSFAQYFLNENFGGAMPTDLSIWTELDAENPVTKKRGVSARTSLLAKNLQDYLNTIQDKDFDTKGSAFRDSQDLKDRIKIAIRGLQDGNYDNSDKLNLAKLGLPTSFFDALFQNGTKVSLQTDEATKMKADQAAINADPTAKTTQQLQEFKKYYDNFRGREFNNTINFGGNDKREKAISQYYNKYHNKVNPTRLFELFNQNPEVFQNPKSINRETGNAMSYDLAMNAYLVLRNRIKKGDLDQFYLGQPGHYAIAGTEHDGNRAMWAIDTHTAKIFEVNIGQIPQLWSKYKQGLLEKNKGLDISLDDSSGTHESQAQQGANQGQQEMTPEQQEQLMKANAAQQKAAQQAAQQQMAQQQIQRHQLGGVVLYDRDDGLDTMKQEFDEYHKQLQEEKAAKLKEKQEAEKKEAEAAGKTVEQLRASKRIPAEAGFKAEDYERMAAMGADIAALGASFIPGYGTAAAAGLGVGSTVLDAVADFSDDSVGMGEAFKNLAINTGLTALSLVPGMGIAKGGKWMRTAVKWGPGLLVAWNALNTATDPEVHNMFSKLGDPKAKFTVEDYKALGRVLTTVASVGVGAVNTYKASKMGKAVAKAQKTSSGTLLAAEEKAAAGKPWYSDEGIYSVGKKGRVNKILTARKNAKVSAETASESSSEGGFFKKTGTRIKNAANALRGKTPSTGSTQASGASTTQATSSSSAASSTSATSSNTTATTASTTPTSTPTTTAAPTTTSAPAAAPSNAAAAVHAQTTAANQALSQAAQQTAPQQSVNVANAIAATVNKKGGILRVRNILKMQSGGIAPTIPTSAQWYNSYYNTQSLPGWNPNLNHSQAGNSIVGNGHGYAGDLNMAYYKNQQYTSNPQVMQTDIGNYAKSQNFNDINSFITTYNNNVKTLDDDKFFSQNYGTKNDGVQQHNDMFGSMYGARNDNSNNPYNIGTQNNIENIYGSSTFLRRGIKFEKPFDQDTPENQKNRIMNITLNNGQTAQVYFNADGTISPFTGTPQSNQQPAPNNTGTVNTPAQPQQTQVQISGDGLNLNYEEFLKDKDLQSGPSWQDKTLDLLQRATPSMIATGRLAATLAANERMRDEKVKGISSFSTLSNEEQHRNIYGDFASKYLSDQKAAQVENSSRINRTADAALNKAESLERTEQGNQLRTQGDLQYNQGILQTKEQANQVESNNVQQNIATANENIGRASAAQAAIHDIDAALISHNALQKDTYWKDLEYKLTNRQNLIDKSQYALENFDANQEASQKLNDFVDNYKPKLDALSEKIKKASAENNEEEYNTYMKQYNTLKDEFIKGKQNIQNEALRKQYAVNLARATRMFKNGGDIEKINARIRMENLKQYKKDLQNQQKNHLYMLNNLSNATKSLILKSFGIK